MKGFNRIYKWVASSLGPCQELLRLESGTHGFACSCPVWLATRAAIWSIFPGNECSPSLWVFPFRLISITLSDSSVLWSFPPNYCHNLCLPLTCASVLQPYLIPVQCLSAHSYTAKWYCKLWLHSHLVVVTVWGPHSIMGNLLGAMWQWWGRDQIQQWMEAEAKVTRTMNAILAWGYISATQKSEISIQQHNHSALHPSKQ